MWNGGGAKCEFIRAKEKDVGKEGEEVRSDQDSGGGHDLFGFFVNVDC